MARSYGHLRSIQVANPAAGAQWSVGPALGKLWIINSGTAQYTTDATAGNRSVSFQLKDPAGNIVGRWGASGAQAPSVGASYNIPSAGAGSVGASHILMPYGIVIGPGWTLVSAVGAAGAGDTWTQIGFSVEEFNA